MISVDAALKALFDLVVPLPCETVPLRQANGRVLCQPLKARRSQPPFDASSMDGYALKAQELEEHALFKVIGEAAAGHGWSGSVGPGQAVRIFTGAPVPEGADTVVIQENVDRTGDLITIIDAGGSGTNIRPAGGDFRTGDSLSVPRRLSPADLALLASMNIASLPVTRKPVVALISTGDELVMPGEDPGQDQIISSNAIGLAAMMEGIGATPRLLPIARDDAVSLAQAFELAKGADLMVTIGGASVGDHDLVAGAAADAGMEQSFYKVAMRPGKPLMAGRMADMPMIGLPGNPVSAMVCGRVFLQPVVEKMLGLGAVMPTTDVATLAAPVPKNGPRAHYMRAVLEAGQITAFDRQDSSLLRVLSEANALLLRPPNDPALETGATVRFLAL